MYWLSGLTCTEQNFITKAGAQAHAAEHAWSPPTPVRGAGVADAERYDLGQGAGFYVDATEAPWAPHYQMQTYIAEELPALIEAHFPANDRRGISGHSMGGHGALVTALRHPGRYASVSAFSPIVAPSQVPWGREALTAYLGADPAVWAEWAACALIARASERLPLRVDQGLADEFLVGQLRPELLEAVCAAVGHPLDLRRHAGYDHSYYFIASFIGEHVAHHARALRS
jgi:S-formylglutathione hydrolase